MMITAPAPRTAITTSIWSIAQHPKRKSSPDPWFGLASFDPPLKTEAPKRSTIAAMIENTIADSEVITSSWSLHRFGLGVAQFFVAETFRCDDHQGQSHIRLVRLGWRCVRLVRLTDKLHLRRSVRTSRDAHNRRRCGVRWKQWLGPALAPTTQNETHRPPRRTVLTTCCATHGPTGSRAYRCHGLQSARVARLRLMPTKAASSSSTCSWITRRNQSSTLGVRCNCARNAARAANSAGSASAAGVVRWTRTGASQAASSAAWATTVWSISCSDSCWGILVRGLIRPIP